MAKRGRPRHPDVLTPREWEVLAFLREGLSNEEIAQRLGISLAGAKYHVSEILGKLGVSSREEAAAWEPERRAWWTAAALAPWRPVTRWPLPAFAAAASVVVLAAGIALLVWGLARTGGGPVPGTAQAGLIVPRPLSPPEDLGPETGTFVVSDDGSTVERLGPPGTVSPDGRSVAVAGNSGRGIFVFAEGRAETTQVFDGQANVAAWSPDGRWLAISALTADHRQMVIARADGSGYRTLLGEGGLPVWSPDGDQIATFRDVSRNTQTSTIVATTLVVVDLDGRVAADFPLGEYDVGSRPNQRGPVWSPSTDRLAWLWHPPNGPGQILIMDVLTQDVSIIRMPAAVAYESDLSWSPDDRFIVVAGHTQPRSLPKLYIAAGGEDVATGPIAHGGGAVWSPDGTRIAFIGNMCEPQTDNLGADLMVVNRDGTGRRTITPLEFELVHGVRWLARDDLITFYTHRPAPAFYTVHPDGTGLHRIYSPSTVVNYFDFATDGSRLYFISIGGYDTCLDVIAD